jgi:hypothetical protein
MVAVCLERTRGEDSQQADASAASYPRWSKTSSAAAQELKLLTEDYPQQIRQQTRLINQLTATLKAYYPRALEIAALPTPLAREFLWAYPTPEAVAALTERQWQRWARSKSVGPRTSSV